MRIFNQPIILSILSPITNHQNCVINNARAIIVKINSTGVMFDEITKLNLNRDWANVSYSFFKSILTSMNPFITFSLQDFQIFLEKTILLFSNVFIGTFCLNPMLLNVIESYLYFTSMASVIYILAICTAIEEIRNRKFNKLPCF